MRALRAVLTGAAIGILAMALPIFTTTTIEPAQEQETPGEQLFREYSCWRDDGLPHPEPQGALITMPGREPRIYPAARGYRIWLEAKPGTLHGFCKEGPK